MAPSTVVAALVLLALCVAGAAAQQSLSNCNLGRITAYTGYDNGACGFGNLDGSTGPGNNFGAALNTAFYAGSLHCGECYELFGQSGSQIVMVTDQCPQKGNEEWCSGDINHFDLTEPAFPPLAPASVGVANVFYRQVACEVRGNVQLLVSDSNPYWFRPVLFSHVVGIRAVAFREQGQTAWVSANRTDDNHWPYQSVVGTLQLPLAVRVTSQYGDQIEGSLAATVKGSSYNLGAQFPAPPASGSDSCCDAPDVFSTVYDRGTILNGTWYDQSYGDHTVTIGAACDVTGLPAGSQCVRAQLGGFAGFQPDNSFAKGLAQYATLDFWVKSDSAAAALAVRLGSRSPATVGNIGAGWQHITLSLQSDLGLSGSDTFSAINLQNNANSAATFYFAQVRLLPAAGFSPGCACGNPNSSKAGGGGGGKSNAAHPAAAAAALGSTAAAVALSLAIAA